MKVIVEPNTGYELPKDFFEKTFLRSWMYIKIFAHIMRGMMWISEKVRCMQYIC